MQKDEQEELEKFQTLIKFIRPEAFSEDKKVQFSVDFIESIEEKLGRELTEEERDKIERGEEIDNEEADNLDLIEPADKNKE